MKAKALVLLVVLLLFPFNRSESTENQESKKGNAIVYLVCADTGFGTIYDVDIGDTAIETAFVSEPLLRFNVPASPNSDALFIEWWTTFVYAWSVAEIRRSECKICLRIISGSIPNNINVWQSLIVHREHNTGDIVNPGISLRRIECIKKIILRRDNVDEWLVTYASGPQASDEIVLPIFNKIIDGGFNVEVWAEGMIQGMKIASYRNVIVEIAPLVKGLK